MPRKQTAQCADDHLKFQQYIYKVLKQVHPEVGISTNAMQIMNSFVGDVLKRVLKQVYLLTMAMGKTCTTTVTSREVQTAVRLALNGELTKHAISEGIVNATMNTTISI